MSSQTLLLLPGDGIGPEIQEAMEPIFAWLTSRRADIAVRRRLVGHQAFTAEGATISDETLVHVGCSEAVLFGAESTEEYLSLPHEARPAPALLRLRAAVGGFANVRPVRVYPPLVHLSPLKAEIVSEVDFVIVRELLGGLYFGEPRSIKPAGDGGRRRALDSLVYTSDEIERVAVAAFDLAATRAGRLCSVDKANVLATGALWREVVTDVGRRYPQVRLSHMYVDNCAMQLVRAPGQFDVIVTENMFGDILSDCAAVIGGSIGMLASASLGRTGADGRAPGLYEAISGSAPDIAGQDVANPIGTVLSLAMALEHSLGAPDEAAAVENAVAAAIEAGARTRDLGGDLGTRAMVSLIAEHLE